MNACIIKNPKEFTRASKVCGKETLYLCTNEEAHRAAAAQAASIRLDDGLLHEERYELNAWAVERAYALIDKLKMDASAHHFFQAHFLAINSLFSQTAKTARVLDDVSRSRGLTRLQIFEDPRAGDEPFVAICKAYTKHLNPAIQLNIEPFEHQPSCAKRRFRDRIDDVMARGSTLLGRGKIAKAARRGEALIFLSGGLNHLGSVSEFLGRKDRHRVVFFEKDFNFEKFFFCLRTGAAYLIVREGPRTVPVMPDRSFGKGENVYKGVDYSAALEQVLRELLQGKTLNRCFAEPIFHESTLKDLFDRYSPHAVILDEDWAPSRRSVSVYAMERGHPSFVVSHGVPAARYYLESSGMRTRRHDASRTLVNSEFEKGQYEKEWFDPANIFVLGTPRYDEIFRIKAAARTGRKTAKTILYCPAFMFGSDFAHFRPWIGMRDVYRERTRGYTLDILGVLKDLPNTQLIIKPRPGEDGFWRDFEKNEMSGFSVRHKIVSSREDLFQLEARADLVITIESSVICEAIMFDKPVVVLNYEPEVLTGPYEKDGLVERAADADGLKKSMRKCLYDETYLDKLAGARQEVFPHYGGFFDGRNTARVADFTLQNRTARLKHV